MPVAGRRSLVAGRRSPVAGRRSPVTGPSPVALVAKGCGWPGKPFASPGDFLAKLAFLKTYIVKKIEFHSQG